MAEDITGPRQKHPRFLLKAITASLIAGAIGAALGMVTGMLFVGEQHQPELFTSAVISYQNFAIGAGAISGFVLGAASSVVFLTLAKRVQYPRSLRAGAWLGAASGAIISLVTCSAIYVAADSFHFVPSSTATFVVDSLISALVGGVAGLVAGYLLAEIGGRDMAYWD